jgi:hypothetical protein
MSRLTDEQMEVCDVAQTALQCFGAGEGVWTVIVARGGTRRLVPVTVGPNGGPLLTAGRNIVEQVQPTPSDWDLAVREAGYRPADPYEDGRMRWHAGDGGTWLGQVVR